MKEADAKKPVWFITGCSTGFGRAIAGYVLSLGYNAVVTARKVEQVADLVAGAGERALVLTLDVTNSEEIQSAVAAAEKHFGRIDVLVNNAGIGYFGSFEESDLAEVRRMIDINVWGLVEMTRAVLPGMRAQGKGAIVNLASIAGLVGLPSLSFYNASKFAVVGISEALSAELAPLGIRVLALEPGPFRTDWAGRSAKDTGPAIKAYQGTAGARMEMIRGYAGKQPGDPARLAKLMVEYVEAEKAPLHLVLGKPALGMAKTKMEAMLKGIEEYAAVSLSADFPEGE